MKKKKAGSMAVMLLILIYLLIPLVVSIIYSMFDKWTGIAPEGFNLGNYATLFSDPEFLATMGRTVAMCIIPICLTIVIVLVMLFGAYCIIILPYIYQGIRNGMRAVNMPMLLEAAEMLGASKLYAFFKVIVPNILSAIIVSSLLAVGIIFGDYVLIRNLAGTSFPNLQIFLYQTMKSDSTKSSAVFVVIMLVTFIITAIVLFLKSREAKGRKQKN